MTRIALLATTAAATLTVAAASQAAVVMTYDFDVNAGGFAGNNLAGPVTVSGGLLSGEAPATGTGSTDPQLVNGSTEIAPTTGFEFDSIIARVREFDDNDNVITSFSSTGILVAFNGAVVANGNSTPNPVTAVDSGDGFFTVTFDLGSFGSTPITSIRLDPIGGPDANGNRFDVDFIQITDTAPVPVPEPTAAAGMLAAGGLLMARRRR